MSNDNAAKHTIVLPSGVKIDTNTEISISPDGSIRFPQFNRGEEVPGGTFVRQDEPAEDMVDTEGDVTRTDLDHRGDGLEDGTLYSNDVLNLLSPPVRSNVYLGVLDILLNLSDAHYTAVLTVYGYEDPVSSRSMSQVMGITEAAAANRMVMIRRLGALQPADRYGEYWLDGVFADVLDEWQSEIEAERKRRSNIMRVYKSSHGGYTPDF